MNEKIIENIRIDKLVHGGQGLGELPDGRKIFVWGALPGELIHARIFKNRRQYAEAVATAVVEAAPQRITEREACYLATSPWQILDYTAENTWKKTIIEELFTQAHVTLPAFDFIAPENDYEYRNKMEFAFWADEKGLSLAHFSRGSHHKIPVTSSLLAMPAVNQSAQSVREVLESAGLEGRQLKTVIVRATRDLQTVAAVFVKDKSIPMLRLPPGLDGLNVYYSDPRSPASVVTNRLQKFGSDELSDQLLGMTFHYTIDSFFQVNVPIFEVTLGRIKEQLGKLGGELSTRFSGGTIVDMYSGVGSIGLSVGAAKAVLVDIDAVNSKLAKRNASANGVKAKSVTAPSEKALEYISPDLPIILDPPRAGLHRKVMDRLLETRPPFIAYLSCNPATQARDCSMLSDAYRVEFFEAYNYFPHTPHIESLAILLPKA